MAMIDEMCRAVGADPEEVAGTKIEDTDLGNTNDISTAAGEDDESSPGCPFYCCFACRNGHCTALKDNCFQGRPCPFFKTAAQAKKDLQDSFDRLLMDGRLDLINKYEEVFVSLGLVDPEDAGEGSRIDDDVIKARAEMAEFMKQLDSDIKKDGDADEEFFEE